MENGKNPQIAQINADKRDKDTFAIIGTGPDDPWSWP